MANNRIQISKLDKRMAPLSGSDIPLLWHRPDAPPFRLSGFPWYEQDRIYRRLPLKPSRGIPGPVDQLANCTAGGQVAFRSDSTHLAVRVTLAGLANMNHMPATGQCGFDLYVGPPCAQRFHSVSKYDHTQTDYELLLFSHPEPKMRDFVLNFPLYQGVQELQVGLTPQAQIAPPLPWSTEKRIVAYGTSITQGGCASRPGMAYTNILSRALNVEMVNLGFSGNGRGEPEVIGLAAEVPDPQLWVLDYEANSRGELGSTLPEAIRVLRDRRRRVPILIVSRIAFAKDATHLDSLQARTQSRDMQARLVADARQQGDHHIHFMDGAVLVGEDDDECTVDGVHPNDLGFMRMARRLEIEIRRILDLSP